MTDLDEITDGPADAPVDGRVARRQRNIDAVLDVVLQMFEEDAMFPTIEQAATRSGLSLRSLYRYFSDPEALSEAAIKRSEQVAAELTRLHAIGQGPLDDRIDAFVAMRLRLHEAVGARFRATVANAARYERINEQLRLNRGDMLEQFELQFAPELVAMNAVDREAAVAAGDLLTQLESVLYLRRQRELSVKQTHKVLVANLQAILR